MSEYRTLQQNQSLNAEYERNKKEREMQQEIERLKGIIKEVREYIESFIKVFEGHYPFVDIREIDLNKLLEILDKVEEK